MVRSSLLSWTRPLALALAVAGCNTGEDPNPPNPDAGIGLRRMVDCDDLRQRMEDEVLEYIVQSRYGYRGYYEVPGDAEGDNSGGGAGGGSGAPDAPSDITGTNNQEEGVDELDLVKSNAAGTLLFVAQDRCLQIVKSWPADQSALLSQIDLPGWASGLFAVGDKLVVFTSIDESTGDIDGDPEQYFYGTRLTVVDVSDPAAPEIERTIDVAGYAADARLIDGKVHFVANQWMNYPQEAWELAWREDIGLPEYPAYDAPQAEWDAAMATARAILRPLVADVLADVDIDSWLPQFRENEGDLQAMFACDDLYAPETESPLAMLAVATFDPATGSLGTTGVLSQGWTVYASAQNLYVAQTSQWWWGWGTSADDYGKSRIHKFALGGTEPVYTASGEVDGWLYDQFAMSEYDGHLRVVTTDLTTWWGGGIADGGGGVAEGGGDGSSDTDAPPAEDEPVPAPAAAARQLPPPEPANNVFVLRDNAQGVLEQVGHVGGIAPNEQVYAVRMLGEKGYVVTFRQTDPLFTIDLSDPTAPAVVGELVMPGYSAYLHPFDADHLLAVGMAGTDTGQLTGLSVNLFDVSDMANPTLLHSHEVAHGDSSWSYSEALWDHHAFTYDRGVLTIPAFTESWDEVAQTWSGFSGTISFDVSIADGISEAGRVDHVDLVDASECLYDWWWGGVGVEDDVSDSRDTGGATEPGVGGGEVPPDGGTDTGGGTEPAFSYCDWDYGYWYAQVRRSWYADEYLYTISNYGVKVSLLADPSDEIATVVFYPESAPE